jgi:hypothetical protein
MPARSEAAWDFSSYKNDHWETLYFTMLSKLFSLLRPLKSDAFDAFFIGQSVYLSQQYFIDSNTKSSVLPRFGWNVKSISGSMATIVHQSGNNRPLKIYVDCRYLKKELS